MEIKLSCDVCNSSRFILDSGMGDDALIACDDCGHEMGTLGELKDALGREILRQCANSQNVRPEAH